MVCIFRRDDHGRELCDSSVENHLPLMYQKNSKGKNRGEEISGSPFLQFLQYYAVFCTN